MELCSGSNYLDLVYTFARLFGWRPCDLDDFTIDEVDSLIIKIQLEKRNGAG